MATRPCVTRGYAQTAAIRGEAATGNMFVACGHIVDMRSTYAPARAKLYILYYVDTPIQAKLQLY